MTVSIQSDSLLSTKEAARFLSVHPNTLVKWRIYGGGPNFVHLSRRKVGYRRSAIELFVQRRTFNTTAQRGVDPTTLDRKRGR